MRAALARVTALGVCGAAPAGAGSDGPGERAPAAVWARWWQRGAYLPVFRAGAGPDGCGARPGLAEPARVALAERRRLLPYHAALGASAGLTGVPAVRPVWWDTPEDRELREGGDAFLLGDAFLVVPVLEPGGGPSAVRCRPGGGTTRPPGGRTRGVPPCRWRSRRTACRCSRGPGRWCRCAGRTGRSSGRCGRPRPGVAAPGWWCGSPGCWNEWSPGGRRGGSWCGRRGVGRR
nr:TIM-barrel domain-containing protein [Streptomyces gougerotii]